MFVPSAFKSLDGIFNLPKLETQYDSFTLKAPIKFSVSITNTGDAFLLRGKANADATTSCSRCLENVDTHLEATIDAYYLITPPDDQDSEINEFEILSEDHNIPLGDIIKDTMIVDTPAKPLCDDDCKGLCPKCGINLNKSLCKCVDEPDESNPFSALKDFKV